MPTSYNYAELLGQVIFDRRPTVQEWLRIFETLWQRGDARYKPLQGAVAGQPVFVEGKWRVARENVTGVYDPAKFDDLTAGVDRFGFDYWDNQAHQGGYRCLYVLAGRVRMYEALVTVGPGDAPDLSPQKWVEISPTTGTGEPFVPGFYLAGERVSFSGLIFQVPGVTGTLVDARTVTTPIAAGWPVVTGGVRFALQSGYEVVNQPLELSGPISRVGNVLAVAPRLIPTDRQGVLDAIANFNPAAPATGLIPGAYLIEDARQRLVGGEIVYDRIRVTALDGQTLSSEAYNDSTQQRGTYDVVADTWTPTGAGGANTNWGEVIGDLDDQTDLIARLALVLSQAQSYTDQAATGVFRYRGEFSALAGSWPTTGGTGASGAVRSGNAWLIAAAGTLSGATSVQVGDVIIAKINDPGQTAANWTVLERNLDYLPENVANKNQANGYAGLDPAGRLAVALLPLVAGLVAGTYGSSSQVPQIAVDTTGRVTSVGNVNIASSFLGVFRSGALTVSLPFPGPAKPTFTSLFQAGCNSVTFALRNGSTGAQIGSNVVWDGTAGNEATARAALQALINANPLPFELDATAVLTSARGTLLVAF